jgi:hypothetical protein
MARFKLTGMFARHTMHGLAYNLLLYDIVALEPISINHNFFQMMLRHNKLECLSLTCILKYLIRLILFQATNTLAFLRNFVKLQSKSFIKLGLVKG